MSRGGAISFSFPPFAGWVRRIILTCTAIFFAELILRQVFKADLRWVDEWFALIPVFVMKGEIWQLVTYSLLHQGWSHLFFNMLTLWFIGAYLERDWGPQRFIECYLFCVVGAAVVTVAVAYTHFLGMDPH
ncbi:MAG: rhomboid family intramembrane serine protease, partial [Terriglobales bacterium]